MKISGTTTPCLPESISNGMASKHVEFPLVLTIGMTVKQPALKTPHLVPAASFQKWPRHAAWCCQDLGSSPVRVPVLEPNCSASMPNRWSRLTYKLLRGTGRVGSNARC